jgi:hypothetical protein
MVDGKDANKGFSKTCYYELLDVDRKADTKTIDKVKTTHTYLFRLTRKQRLSGTQTKTKIVIPLMCSNKYKRPTNAS